MIGRTTLFWLGSAALVGFGLFSVKYQVMTLEERLARLNAATLREQNQIHVLEAEWSYLNRPARLEELAERHLALLPIAPHQFGTVAALPKRPTMEDFVANPDVLAKILPQRKPALPVDDGTATGAPDAASVMAKAAPRQPQLPLPGPVTPAGLAVEKRP